MRAGWTYKKLREVCAEKKQIKRAAKCFSSSEQIQYIDISSIDSSIRKMTVLSTMSMKEAPSRAQQKVEMNDILISTVRPNLKNIAIVDREDYNLVASSGFCVLRTSSVVEQRFVYYFVTSDLFTNHLVKLTTGANYPAVRDQDILESFIPLPPIPQQRLIVSELDEINSLIALKREQLKKYDELAQSLFYEMFGDPVENEKGWEVKKLGEHIQVIGGYAFKSELFREEGIPVLRIGNINSGNFKSANLVFWKNDPELTRYEIYPGDLVISLTGTVGKSDYGNVCILGNDYSKYYLNQRNAKFQIIKNIDKHFLSALLRIEDVKAKLTGVNRGVRQANIANRDIENLSIPLPPLPLQQLFAHRIEQIEEQKKHVTAAIAKLETLLASRMQYWFE